MGRNNENVDDVVGNNSQNFTVNNNNANNIPNNDLPQLLESGGHVILVPRLEVDDFQNYKDRMLAYLDGIEPFILKILNNSPSKTRDTKIASLKLKVNAFKALYGEKLCYPIREDFTKDQEQLEQLRCPLTGLRRLVSTMEGKDTYKGLYRQQDFISIIPIRITKNKDKGLVAETYDWDKEKLSSEDDEFISMKAFMALAKDEPSVGKNDARLGPSWLLKSDPIQRIGVTWRGPHSYFILEYSLTSNEYGVLKFLDTTYWMGIVLLLIVDQSILCGVSSDVDTTYSSKSGNSFDLV
ncbi:hypothetical protein Tco_0033731 [Tanacetum coccineum]